MSGIRDPPPTERMVRNVYKEFYETVAFYADTHRKNKHVEKIQEHIKQIESEMKHL